MNCLFSGAIVCIGGAQKRAGGVASAKYSIQKENTLFCVFSLDFKFMMLTS